jgi:adenosylhomocysteine nucleosidase
VAEEKKIAIIAALEREVRPLVRDWKPVQVGDRGLKAFELRDVIVVCGGIGQEAARRAAESVVREYHPELLISAGFAGALEESLKAGQVLWPGKVIDAKDNSRSEIESGTGVLVSFPAIAGAEQKAKLASSYNAQAVDMEAAAVAKAAEKHGIGFMSVKAISDERDFEPPPLEGFVTSSGKFRDGAFVWFALLRPWLWPNVLRLARNSSRASKVLCLELKRFVEEAEQGTLRQLQPTHGV